MEYKIEGSRRNKKFVEALMPSVIKQLKLTSSKKVVVVNICNDDSGRSGYTIPIDALGAYLVIIKADKKLKEIALTLAHEMEHVRQFAKGLVKPCKGGHMWMGKKIKDTTPYLDLPWEQLAFAKQEIIMRRAIDD